MCVGAARREEMEPSPAKGKAQGRLLVSTSLDAKDELEEVGIDSFPLAVNFVLHNTHL